jgi:plasmid stability protein
MPAFNEYNAGMQYTLRKIPSEVDKALRRRARKEGKSLNEVAIEALSRGAGVETTAQNHELDFAISSWIEDPEFDKAMENQRQIDADLWT